VIDPDPILPLLVAMRSSSLLTLLLLALVATAFVHVRGDVDDALIESESDASAGVGDDSTMELSLASGSRVTFGLYRDKRCRKAVLKPRTFNPDGMSKCYRFKAPTFITNGKFGGNKKRKLAAQAFTSTSNSIQVNLYDWKGRCLDNYGMAAIGQVKLSAAKRGKCVRLRPTFWQGRKVPVPGYIKVYGYTAGTAFIESESGLEAETETEAEAEVDTDSELEAKVDAESESESEAETEAALDMEVEAEAEVEAESELSQSHSVSLGAGRSVQFGVYSDKKCRKAVLKPVSFNPDRQSPCKKFKAPALIKAGKLGGSKKRKLAAQAFTSTSNRIQVNLYDYKSRCLGNTGVQSIASVKLSAAKKGACVPLRPTFSVGKRRIPGYVKVFGYTVPKPPPPPSYYAEVAMFKDAQCKQPLVANQKLKLSPNGGGSVGSLQSAAVPLPTEPAFMDQLWPQNMTDSTKYARPLVRPASPGLQVTCHYQLGQWSPGYPQCSFKITQQRAWTAILDTAIKQYNGPNLASAATGSSVSERSSGSGCLPLVQRAYTSKYGGVVEYKGAYAIFKCPPNPKGVPYPMPSPGGGGCM